MEKMSYPTYSDLELEIQQLEEENKKLNEFKDKREECMFYFKAQMERAEPKTAKEAEDLQIAKELFEKLYRKELHRLEEENKKLNDKYNWLWKIYTSDVNDRIEENQKLHIKVASLEWEIKWLNYTIDKLREELSAYDREYFDEDKKAKNMFMEEDTLQ